MPQLQEKPITSLQLQNQHVETQTTSHLGSHFPEESRCNILLNLNVQGGRIDDWLTRRVLHGQERLYGLDLGVVATVGHGLALGSQAKRRHPLSVLQLLAVVKTNC